MGLDKEAKRHTPYMALAHQAWVSGRIPSEQAEAVLAQRQRQSKKPREEVELVMFPRVDLLRHRGGAHDSRKRQVLLPLGVFVRLDRHGQLRPAAQAPWIPREWLGPNQSAAEPIADVTTVDDFISTYAFEGIETWRELVGYCTRMLCSVTEAEYVAADEHQPGTSLFEIDIHADYEPIEQSLLQVEDLPLVSAKVPMLKVLETLGEMAELPPLYRCYASRAVPQLKPSQDLEFDTRLAKQHVGQMTGEFPLSPKQRHALHRCSRETIESLQQALAGLQALVERHRICREKLEAWIARHRPETLNAKALAGQINEINDRVLRFELFKLATHYWEARWLLELDDFLTSQDADKKSPSKVIRKLRRFAKLMPCFVSTFYMTPSTFMAGEYQDHVWRDIPLFGEIDLLIVDEAGQVLPDVSAATFALAKRALVVGDTDQIEPVWSVPASVDRANLKLYNLLEDERSYDDFWLASGLLASSGNVMRIAQRQCHYHQFPRLQRGLYLTEHRRGYDDIIGYCNVLVYQGVLEPLRGDPQRHVPWGILSMVSVEEPSRSYGGSVATPARRSGSRNG